MKRMASVSLIVAAFGASTGCAAPVDPTDGAGEPAAQGAPATMAAPRSDPKTEMDLVTYTYWVAFENGWSALPGVSGQPYGAGTGGYPNYTFTFPTPWISWIGTTGQTNPIVDFDAWMYEHAELVPIESNDVPAYDSYQWWVAQVTVESCSPPNAPPSTLYSTVPCVGSFVTGLRFLVPFTNTTEEGALEAAEASEFGKASDVDAGITFHPQIFELISNGEGGFVTGTGPGGATNLLLSGPIQAYPYADVHDPREPPN
jgi:hypothetical protein